MRDWRIYLGKLVQHGDRLPEHLRESVHAEPPSGGGLPKELPTCPALADLYAACDGGCFGYFTIVPLEEVEDLRECSGDDELASGRYVVFGDTEFGHPLVWDSTDDRVGYYDPDGADGLVLSDETGMPGAGLPVDGFLTRLFSPGRPIQGDETQQSWVEALEALDRMG